MAQQFLDFKRRKKRPPSALEHDEQVALFKWWAMTSWSHSGVVMFAVPNGGARDKVTGARLKAEGVLAGVPDIFLAAQRGEWNGLFIELKRERGGKVSEAQKAVIARLLESGYAVTIAHGWIEAKAAIERYLGGVA